MIRKPLVLIVLVLIGCSKSSSHEEAESARVLLEERQWALKSPKSIDTMKVKQEAPEKLR
jgi:hypothetical protein